MSSTHLLLPPPISLSPPDATSWALSYGRTAGGRVLAAGMEPRRGQGRTTRSKNLDDELSLGAGDLASSPPSPLAREPPLKLEEEADELPPLPHAPHPGRHLPELGRVHAAEVSHGRRQGQCETSCCWISREWC